MPLPFQGATIGALNTYPAWVAVAVGNAEAAARTRVDLKTREDLNHFRIAMMSRAYIEQAKGVLMERHKIKEDEAFRIIIHASQRTNLKLRDVAAELVPDPAWCPAPVFQG